MKLKIDDIIDLEYLMAKDEEKFQALPDDGTVQKRDRRIYKEMGSASNVPRDLLMGWLSKRREQISNEPGYMGFLPGQVFVKARRMLTLMMAATGLVLGFAVSSAFLAYHGARPVNVTLFVFLFIGLPVLLSLTALTWLLIRFWRKKRGRSVSTQSFVQSALLMTLLKGMPKLLGRLDWDMARKGREMAEYGRFMVKRRLSAFQGVFFWPVLTISSILAACFSIGTLVGILFRVIVSDLAFGWQSTLLTSKDMVYDLVRIMAWPWRGFISSAMAHPGIEQIEGSRIVLKEGISALATPDLVSWWPFLCLGIFFYAVLPRLFLVVTALAAQRRKLAKHQFKGPAYNDLIIRMTSPVISVQTEEKPVSTAIEENPMTTGRMTDLKEDVIQAQGLKTAVLVPEAVYPENLQDRLMQGIQDRLRFQVETVIPVANDMPRDKEKLKILKDIPLDQAVLVQEAWQPPIKGLLFYIRQLSEIFGEKPLYIVLTNDASSENLALEQDSVDVDIWQKALFKLENPMIRIKRFI